MRNEPEHEDQAAERRPLIWAAGLLALAVSILVIRGALSPDETATGERPQQSGAAKTAAPPSGATAGTSTASQSGQLTAPANGPDERALQIDALTKVIEQLDAAGDSDLADEARARLKALRKAQTDGAQ